MHGSTGEQVTKSSKAQGGGWKNRVRVRILVPFTFVILLVIAVFVVSSYIHENRDHELELANKVAAAERMFRLRLEQDAKLMQATLTALSGQDGLKKAFLAGDRALLLERATPLFDSLQKENRITHFYFTRPNRVSFLRVHQPGRYGDVIDRITTLRAVAVREGARGIELGPLGTFTLRVVIPWFDHEKVIGYLELGEEIGHLIEEVHGILDVDLLVLVNKKYLNPKLWKTGRRMLGHQDDWERFGSNLVVGRAMKTIPKTLSTILGKEGFSTGKVVQFVENDRNIFAAFKPMKEISGRAVGEFIVAQDVTDLQKSFRNFMAMIGGFSILVGGVVFMVFYAILGRVEKDYRRQREVELQLSRVNTEHQKVVQVEKLSAIGLMIGEIAHQLNNPLAWVVNMAQLAEREVNDPERTRELLGAIAKAGKDSHAFVKRMLEFTKISGFTRKPTDMNRLIEETIALFQQSAGKVQNIETCMPKVSPTLNIDPVLVRHALFNLVSNAGKANPDGGAIKVTLSTETRSIAGWKISVQDQGDGIPESMKEKIFTPFFTTHDEGTGLGLPVVQHVAILHEGDISVSNPDEGGALFVLWLPDTRSETMVTAV